MSRVRELRNRLNLLVDSLASVRLAADLAPPELVRAFKRRQLSLGPLIWGRRLCCCRREKSDKIPAVEVRGNSKWMAGGACNEWPEPEVVTRTAQVVVAVDVVVVFAAAASASVP